VIRPEEPPDRERSLEVERLAFGEADEPTIVEAIRDEEGSFALVAEEGDEVVGHVQLSRAWIGDAPVVAVGPIGVLLDRQGRGIGSALVEAGCAEAGARGESVVIVLGDPGFYPRFGFEPAAAHGLRNPFAGVMEDGFVIGEEDFMLRFLGRRPLQLSGTVRWHPAFGGPVEGPGSGP
jgi:putative acetyltransferase